MIRFMLTWLRLLQVGGGQNVPAQPVSIPAAATGTAIPIIVLGIGGFAFYSFNKVDYREFSKYFSREPQGPGASNTAGNHAGIDKKIKAGFAYLKFRKYTLVLSREKPEDEGRVVRKVKLPFKSDAKLELDLDKDYDKYDSLYLTVRHPQKAMKRKRNVQISYLYQNELREKDCFETEADFNNIKYLERE